MPKSKDGQTTRIKSNDKKSKKKTKSNPDVAGVAGGLSSVWCGVLTVFLDSYDEET
jgi:hypothetical protein